MVLYADGGMLASKPYAASGAYINKMSNYCKHCEYKVTTKTGEGACPFNYLLQQVTLRFVIQRERSLLATAPRVSGMSEL